MRLVSTALETPLEIKPGEPTVVRFESASLFARMCASLQAGDGEGALEPYSLWSDGGDRLHPASSMLCVGNVFDLPWNDRSLAGRLYDKMDKIFRENEEIRERIEGLASELEIHIERLTHQISADYHFGIEWSIKQQLKAFSFRIDLPASCSLLDSLILFVDYCADLAPEKLMVFINLEKFLSENDLDAMLERLFFHKQHVLMLEKQTPVEYRSFDRDRIVDLHFLES